jgi:3-oxoacyl-[acyl-carrier protein] reductase
MSEEPARVAIVTGASRGIGLAVAQVLVERGDRVCITGRNAEPLEAFGRVDYLVNNVGTSPVFGPIIDADASAIRKILDINLVSAFEWTQQVYRAWMQANGGAVVNISSVAALRPAPGLGIYGMSKAALIYLTEQLAVELGPMVRVNAVAPAVVKTKFARALYEGREEEVIRSYPAGRLGLPHDVGNAVAFLLSDQATWITGHTIVLDGGTTLIGGVG